MVDNAAFLQAILAAPADDVPRLVYADWLEDRRDPRAEFLRLDCQLTELPPTDPAASRLRARLDELALALEPDWVALVRRQPVEDAVEAALAVLESLLLGSNYVVSFRIYRIPEVAGTTTDQYISTALGPGAVVEERQSVLGGELLEEVERCLRYRGFRGTGPDASALRSPEFAQLVQDVLGYLEQSIAESSAIERIRLRRGQVFYPVIWGFTYVFLKHHCAVVFLGESED
jgi:uncharacterized protein (TIGR02996 family)